MLNIVIVVIALSVGAYLALAPRVSRSTSWQATVTPLASIMGSGFLVSAPLLGGVVGIWAVFCMAVLLALAYLIGSAIRFNIRYFEPLEGQNHDAANHTAFLSRLVLAGAYFISISYYLQLLAAFVLGATGVQSDIAANLLSSALLLTIGTVGIWRGLDALGRIEKYAVALNLGMITALIVALIVYNTNLFTSGDWQLPAVDSSIEWNDIRVLLGLLIVVQGFEASRYLGDQFSPQIRISSMRRAQLISAAIYLVFIALATVLFHPDMGGDVTAIIEMTQPVAVVLPLLLTVAAVGSQFSAAVADTEGAGGLVEEISERKLPIRYAYLLILLVTLTLTWETDVNAIIAYASRAFALYYALQCVVALLVAYQQPRAPARSRRLLLFGMLGLLALLVFMLGIPSE